MKRFALRLAFFSALAGLATVPATAGVVYDNTNSFFNDFNLDAIAIGAASDGDAGSVDTFNSYAPADEFSLSSSGSLDSATIWLWECNGLGASGACTNTEDLTSLDWSIVENNGSTNYPYDGTVVASGVDSSPSGTYVGMNTFNYAVFEETINLGSVALTGGTNYWFIIDNAVTASGNMAAWDQSDGPTTAYDLIGGSPYALTANCGSQEFPGTTCTETFQLSDAGTVPEPSTVLLLAGGLAGLMLLRRKFLA